jgi:hypothetical protein
VAVFVAVAVTLCPGAVARARSIPRVVLISAVLPPVPPAGELVTLFLPPVPPVNVIVTDSAGSTGGKVEIFVLEGRSREYRG